MSSNIKASIVSIFPMELNEVKPGLTPGYFKIPACKDMNHPVIVHISSAIHNLYMGENRNYPIENSSYDVAKAIVIDSIGSMIEYSLDPEIGITHAGLIAIDEEVNESLLKTKYRLKLIELKEIQERWFKKLVQMADNDWAKSHQHTSISDIQRKAAEILNLTDKEWLSVTRSFIPIQCPACRSLIPPDSLICQVCKTVINEIKLKEYQTARSA